MVDCGCGVDKIEMAGSYPVASEPEVLSQISATPRDLWGEQENRSARKEIVDSCPRITTGRVTQEPLINLHIGHNADGDATLVIETAEEIRRGSLTQEMIEHDIGIDQVAHPLRLIVIIVAPLPTKVSLKLVAIDTS